MEVNIPVNLLFCMDMIRHAQIRFLPFWRPATSSFQLKPSVPQVGWSLLELPPAFCNPSVGGSKKLAQKIGANTSGRKKWHKWNSTDAPPLLTSSPGSCIGGVAQLPREGKRKRARIHSAVKLSKVLKTLALSSIQFKRKPDKSDAHCHKLKAYCYGKSKGFHSLMLTYILSFKPDIYLLKKREKLLLKIGIAYLRKYFEPCEFAGITENYHQKVKSHCTM